MAVFLSQRWRQQPQGNAQVDWSNPITEKLFFAYIPGNPKNLAAVRYQGDRELIISPDGANDYLIGPAGKAATYQRIFSQRNTLVQAYTFGFPGQLNKDLSTTSNIYLLSDQSYYLTCQFGFSGSSVEILSTITESDFTEITSFVGSGLSVDLFDNRTRFLSYQFAASQVPTAFLGSTQILMGATAWDGTLATGTFLQSVDVSGVNGQNMLFAAGGFAWSRNLSATELGSLDDNPWQLFRPITQTLYSFPNVFQYSRPQSDNIFILNWSRQPASGTHASALDEIVADPSDYIYAQVRDIVDILDLSPVSMPPAGVNIELNYEAQSGFGGEAVQLEVLDNGTTIKSITVQASTQGTVLILPSEWALVTAWPWSPTLRVTSK